jgi:xanthine/uracil permease
MIAEVGYFPSFYIAPTPAVGGIFVVLPSPVLGGIFVVLPSHILGILFWFRVVEWAPISKK